MEVVCKVIRHYDESFVRCERVPGDAHKHKQCE